MGYAVITADEQRFAPPSWRADAPGGREIVELPLLANLGHSRAHLWRYPARATGRRHYQTVQEEVFVVLEGTVTMMLGEAGDRHGLPPRSLVVLEPRTPIYVVNETDGEAVFFAYGAPADRGSGSGLVTAPPAGEIGSAELAAVADR